MNSQFILDTLGNLKASEVLIELDDKTKPAILKPSGKEDYVHIIMPLKI